MAALSILPTVCFVLLFAGFSVFWLRKREKVLVADLAESFRSLEGRFREELSRLRDQLEEGSQQMAPRAGSLSALPVPTLRVPRRADIELLKKLHAARPDRFPGIAKQARV